MYMLQQEILILLKKQQVFVQKDKVYIMTISSAKMRKSVQIHM